MGLRIPQNLLRWIAIIFISLHPDLSLAYSGLVVYLESVFCIAANQYLKAVLYFLDIRGYREFYRLYEIRTYLNIHYKWNIIEITDLEETLNYFTNFTNLWKVCSSLSFPNFIRINSGKIWQFFFTYIVFEKKSSHTFSDLHTLIRCVINTYVYFWSLFF